MTSPVTYQTAQRIIRLAYRDSGVNQEGDEPNGEQYADGLNRLNDIVNFEQTQGLKLWLITDQSIPLVAGQATYTFSPTGSVAMNIPKRAIQGYYLDNTGIRRPLVVMSREEYTRLSQINQQGAINSFFVDKQLTQLAVSFWLVPDSTAATGTCHLILQTQVTNMVSLTDNTAFPMEWSMFLRWALADDLSTGQPESIMARCSQKAELYRKALEDWDVEDASTSFSPDSRMGYATNSFR